MTAQSQICSSYNSYKSGTNHGDGSGNYYMISGQASFTQAQVESIGQAMCSSEYTNDQARNDLLKFSSLVSQAGLAAFSDCIKSSINGLQFTITYDGDNAPEIVKISAHYEQHLGNPSATKNYVQPTVIDSSAPAGALAAKVSCKGPLYNAGLSHSSLTTADLSMTCRRPVENDPEKTFAIAGRKYGIAYPASITVPTDVGAISFIFGPRFLPPPTSIIVPAFAGEVRAVAFQSTDPAYRALEENGWLECDGRSLKSADYPELYKALGNTWGTPDFGTAFKLPDLRGQFLRGWNHGSPGDPEALARGLADPGNQNPAWGGSSGDRVGSQQGDAFQAHTHSLDSWVYRQKWNVDSTGNIGVLLNYDGKTPTSGPTGKSSPTETRPKNVSVMYVIYTGRLPKS